MDTHQTQAAARFVTSAVQTPQFTAFTWDYGWLMARTSIVHVLAVLVVALAACSRGGGAGETTETTADVDLAEAGTR
jgi:hypothetical protein